MVAKAIEASAPNPERLSHRETISCCTASDSLRCRIGFYLESKKRYGEDSSRSVSNWSTSSLHERRWRWSLRSLDQSEYVISRRWRLPRGARLTFGLRSSGPSGNLQGPIGGRRTMLRDHAHRRHLQGKIAGNSFLQRAVKRLRTGSHLPMDRTVWHALRQILESARSRDCNPTGSPLRISRPL